MSSSRWRGCACCRVPAPGLRKHSDTGELHGTVTVNRRRDDRGVGDPSKRNRSHVEHHDGPAGTLCLRGDDAERVLMVSAQGFVDSRARSSCARLRCRATSPSRLPCWFRSVKECPASTEARKNLSAFVLTGRGSRSAAGRSTGFHAQGSRDGGFLGRPGDGGCRRIPGIQTAHPRTPSRWSDQLRIRSRLNSHSPVPTNRITTKPGSDSFMGTFAPGAPDPTRAALFRHQAADAVSELQRLFAAP